MLGYMVRRPLADTYQQLKASDKIHDLDDNGRVTTRIRFVGVWDTVCAVGLPFDLLADMLNWVVRFRFRDHDLSKNVTKACHALSIDDERRTFWPTMGNEKNETDDRIEQVWFAGVHSNVGGGYPKDHVALVTLDWMIEKAAANGLHFYEEVRRRICQEANVHGQLYDSRSGFAAYYRYRPRRFSRICHSRRPEVEIERPKIHASVFRRIIRATADYAPANIPADVEVVGTRPADDTMVGQIQGLLAQTGPRRQEGRPKLRRLVALRIMLYWLFLTYSLSLAGLAVGFKLKGYQPPDQPGIPELANRVIDLLGMLLPQSLYGFLEPLLSYAGVHWLQALLVAAGLGVLVLLKLLWGGKTRHQARDAWHAFRDKAQKKGI
jgi:hypothetical protein